MSAEARRQQLLDAALEVIARTGYGGLSVDAIAREANVTRPVVYRVFDGLEPLLSALLDRQEGRALAQLTGALTLAPGAQAPEALVAATVRRLARLVADDPLTWRPIFLAPDGTPRAVRERIARDRELVRRRIETLLQSGLRIPGGPDVGDTEVTSHALVGLGEYFGRMILDDPEHLAPERLVGTVQALVFGRRP